MNDGMYLQTYLNLGSDWPLKLISIDGQKNDPMFTSMQMFVLSFPEKNLEEFVGWRHHRFFNQWQDVIYWMSDSEFQFHWPLIAGALSEQGDAS
jgi:hypothetical protein